MGAGFSMIIMLTHFFSKKNTLRFVRIHNLPRKFVKISVSGFSSFIIDVAMGVLTVLFNRQIMKYLDSNALAVYGVIVAVSTLVQCCAYGVGQAAQPIISQNYGAKKYDRIRKVLNVRYSWGISRILNQNSVNSEFVKGRPKTSRSSFFVLYVWFVFLSKKMQTITRLNK